MSLSPRIAAVEPKQERAHATRRRLLDAAVDELLERGYAGLTTEGVARRAGVSRGGQQNHFPHKTTLVAAAVRHLAARQIHELRERLEAVPRGRARVQIGLDVLFEHYSGPMFAAVVELSLAARGDPELREVVATEERNISRTMHELATVIFGDEFDAVSSRWPTAVAAVRGLAVLKLVGRPETTVDDQWSSTRRHLLEFLTEPG